MSIVYFGPADKTTDMLANIGHKSLRVCFGEDSNGPWVKFKIGEGIWSPPLYGEVDPYAPNDYYPVGIGNGL